MSNIQLLLKEMEQEAQTTRKFLSRVPDGQFNYQPHQKSMTMQQLATHIAELPTWVTMALTTNELDFANNTYAPTTVITTAQLVELFEQSLASGKASLENATDTDLDPVWVLRNGSQIYMEMTKGEVIRMAFSQMVHHRAQLGVYLRLLDVPIPGSYGPSADEPNF